jgi:hypothetical protein
MVDYFLFARDKPRIGSYDTESNQKQYPPTRLLARFAAAAGRSRVTPKVTPPTETTSTHA